MFRGDPIEVASDRVLCNSMRISSEKFVTVHFGPSPRGQRISGHKCMSLVEVPPWNSFSCKSRETQFPPVLRSAEFISCTILLAGAWLHGRIVCFRIAVEYSYFKDRWKRWASGNDIKICSNFSLKNGKPSRGEAINLRIEMIQIKTIYVQKFTLKVWYLVQ